MVVNDVVSEMTDMKNEFLHVISETTSFRELLGVVVRRERCAEAMTEIAARRQDRMEREKDASKSSVLNISSSLLGCLAVNIHGWAPTCTGG